MIESLSITNFQSHRDSKFNFDSGVNVIVGPSDGGKSAVVRALGWPINNKPSGDSFRNWDDDNTIVELNTGDTDIIRGKTKTDGNFYCLVSIKQCRNEIYKAFGQGVPEEIKRVLNIGDINIQSQHDPPFLLSQSPGEVARTLNKIVNLDVIDSSLAHANRRVKASHAELVSKKSVLKITKNKIKDLNWLDQADKDLVRLEAVEADLEVEMNEVFDICATIDHVEANHIETAGFKPLLNLEVDVDIIIVLQTKLEDTENKKDSLVDLTKAILENQYNIEDYDTTLNLKSKVDELISLQNKIAEDWQSKKTLGRLIIDIERDNAQILQIEIESKQLEKEFHELMPSICPLCEQEIR